MESNPHFFFAVRLPDEVKENLSKLCDSLKEQTSFKSWVHNQDYHITLAFLGGAPRDQLELAKENVRRILQDQFSFPLTINQLGMFGKSDSPRIFWAGLQMEARLHDLREKVYSACIDAGFSLETRPFNPHITLARKWVGATPFKQEQLLIPPDMLEDGAFIANEVVLYQTHLNKTPKYEAFSTYQLLNR
ncbi:RNA 2',3'-cyclic phosphodiesterase [Bacillus massilinigeriensis]|uniref:RNA 2',3'-cyclic phosphodiesterase n=1 Tax=Bacillus massilionigeriensis TaxID=1805475 RepID=UPI00096B1187|nr:RNA 2',3'-cyclic phosphodiesterase [Bacillus massilionigeriensis]